MADVQNDETVYLTLDTARGWNAGDVSTRRPAGRIKADHIRAQMDPLNFDVLDTFDRTHSSPYRQLMLDMDEAPNYRPAPTGKRGQWGIR